MCTKDLARSSVKVDKEILLTFTYSGISEVIKMSWRTSKELHCVYFQYFCPIY